MGAIAALISSLAGAPAAAQPWTWPVRGEVVTGYADAGGPYAAGQHRGIDIAATVGVPVVTAVGGSVRFAGTLGSSGLTVSVRTADGRFDTSYLHLATTAVRAGQAVAAGAPIGTAGTSGRGSAAVAHLHFGVRDAGTRRYRDPLDLLPPLPGVRDAPRGIPVRLRGPVRVGPAPQPVRRRVQLGSAAAHRFPGRVAEPMPVPVAAPASRVGWAVACAASILAAALIGGGSSPPARRRVRATVARLLPSFGGR